MAQEKIKILNIKIKYRVSGATSAGRKKVKQRQNNNGRGGIRRRKFVRGIFSLIKYNIYSNIIYYERRRFEKDFKLIISKE